jgi:hypothetical protein
LFIFFTLFIYFDSSSFSLIYIKNINRYSVI